ncbi:MAG: MATE family efflux transporter [Clostridia bacterium]|jgi:putative MATE family efflux protein|nr:MATE family efflux transporter [Clostridia bacterium]MBT7122217.1 MATE family efflux transporter [Clostridia bacterium]
MKHTERLGTEKISKLIIRMSIPAIIAMIVQALYNVVDSIFVASISEKALTALSLAFPIQMVIISIFIGLGIGLNSVISRRLGEGNKDEAVNTAEHGFLLGLILWALIAVAAIFLPRWFFSLFTDDPVIIDYATQYTTIIMIFSFGRIFAQVCMSIMQATGDMVSSMKIGLTGAISNIILDPILIFGVLFIPALGVKGAAIATVTGQTISMVVAFILMFKNEKGLKLNLRKFHFDGRITKNIFKVGFPAMLMQGLASIMLAGVNFILAGFGATPIAVFGAFFKLQSFIFMPVFGLCQGMMPIVGFNFGAKNKKRVIDAVKFGALISFCIMSFGLIIFQAFPATLLSLFSSSAEMTQIGITAFRIISIGFPIAGVCIVLSVSFQALGDAHLSLIISFARQILVLLPVAFALSLALNEVGVWIAFPIAEVSCLILIILFAIRTYRRKIKHLGETENEPLTTESLPAS